MSARCLFVSYTGILEPLGQSQVLPYVRGLAASGYTMIVLSFEKDRRRSVEWRSMQEALHHAGIEWWGLRYHKWPPVLATVADVLLGILVSLFVVLRGVRLLHARAHVPAAIALVVGGLTGVPFLFDHRGLMAEEFADAGLWKRDGLLFRSTNLFERVFLRRSAGVVFLTERLAGEAQLAPKPVQVIPCAVDLDRFRPAASRQRPYDIVYAGSWSGLYLAEETLAFFEAVRRLRPAARVLVLVPRNQGLPHVGDHAHVQHATPDEVPNLLGQARAGISLRRPGRAQVAASPVKISEYWACGLPVVSSGGVGDIDQLISIHHVGVVLAGFSEAHFDEAARRLFHLLDGDAELPSRCRELAERRYGLAGAVDSYRRAYRAILDAAGNGPLEEHGRATGGGVLRS